MTAPGKNLSIKPSGRRLMMKEGRKTRAGFRVNGPGLGHGRRATPWSGFARDKRGAMAIPIGLFTVLLMGRAVMALDVGRWPRIRPSGAVRRRC